MKNFEDLASNILFGAFGVFMLLLGFYGFFYNLSGEYTETEYIAQLFFVFISIVMFLTIPTKKVSSDNTNFEFVQNINMKTKIKGNNVDPRSFEGLNQKIGCSAGDEKTKDLSFNKEIELAKIEAEIAKARIEADIEKLKIKAMLENAKIQLEREKVDVAKLFKDLSRNESKNISEIKTLIENPKISTSEKLQLLTLLTKNTKERKLLK